jgi:hypothetical protein
MMTEAVEYLAYWGCRRIFFYVSHCTFASEVRNFFIILLVLEDLNSDRFLLAFALNKFRLD